MDAEHEPSGVRGWVWKAVAFHTRMSVSDTQFFRNYRTGRENFLAYTEKSLNNGLAICRQTESLGGSLVNSTAEGV